VPRVVVDEQMCLSGGIMPKHHRPGTRIWDWRGFGAMPARSGGTLHKISSESPLRRSHFDLSMIGKYRYRYGREFF
jgi:hypothetical protein